MVIIQIEKLWNENALCNSKKYLRPYVVFFFLLITICSVKMQLLLLLTTAADASNTINGTSCAQLVSVYLEQWQKSNLPDLYQFPNAWFLEFSTPIPSEVNTRMV